MNVSFVYIRGLYPGSPSADVGPTPQKICVDTVVVTREVGKMP